MHRGVASHQSGSQVLRAEHPEFLTPEEFGLLSTPQRRILFSEYYTWEGSDDGDGEQRVAKSDNGRWLFRKLCPEAAAAAAKAARATAAAGAV